MYLTRFIPAAAMDKHVLGDMKGKQEGINLRSLGVFTPASIQQTSDVFLQKEGAVTVRTG